jgi:DNA-binding SARP family transcriptional activator
MAGPRFSILGRIRVTFGGHHVLIPRGHALSILGALLAEPNRSVPAGDLVDALWGESPPRTATNTLQVHVATLRRALRDASPALGARLTTDEAGYRLRVEAGELDAGVFGAEVAEARRADRSAAAATADVLRRALAWARARRARGANPRGRGRHRPP